MKLKITKEGTHQSVRIEIQNEAGKKAVVLRLTQQHLENLATTVYSLRSVVSLEL